MKAYSEILLMAAGTEANHQTIGLPAHFRAMKASNRTYNMPIIIFVGHCGGEMNPEGSATFQAKPSIIRARAIRKLSLYFQGKAHVFFCLFVIAIVA